MTGWAQTTRRWRTIASCSRASGASTRTACLSVGPRAPKPNPMRGPVPSRARARSRAATDPGLDPGPAVYDDW